MPNIKSAYKRDAISKARRLRNLSNKTRLHNAGLKYQAALAEGNAENAEMAFRTFSSEIDKAAKKGAITKNSASRRKSRAYAALAKIGK